MDTSPDTSKQPETNHLDADASTAESASKPPAKPRGAPRGNVNALRAGFQSKRFRHGLVMGALPKGAAHIRAAVSQLRGTLESEVVQARGEVTIVDAGLIATACRWEAHAMLAQSWLRTRFADLSDENRLTYSRDVARASGERDKAMAALRLRVPRSDAIASFYDRGLSLDEATDPRADGHHDAGDDAGDHATDHDTDHPP